MPENWAPCRNCPHPPDDHAAVIYKPVCIDPPARVLFEGTLGGCRAPGCACDIWTRQQPTYKELAAESREVPDGCELAAVPDDAWRIEPGRPCRFGGNRPCGRPSAASLERGTRRKQRWAYCQDHMFGRWIEDGKVMHWILRKAERHAG